MYFDPRAKKTLDSSWISFPEYEDNLLSFLGRISIGNLHYKIDFTPIVCIYEYSRRQMFLVMRYRQFVLMPYKITQKKMKSISMRF